MKILFLTRRFYPDIGGVEKHVLEISKHLIALGHTVTVVSEGSNSPQIKKFQKDTGINLYKIFVGNNEKKKKFVIWKWFLKNKNLLEDADVVHCHDVFYWYLPFRFLYPTKPVFTTFHGYESFPIKKKAIIVRKISEKLSWGNICIGDFMKKWYHTKPTFVSYGAVNIPSLRGGTTKQSQMGLPRFARNDENRYSAVFMGRLDEQTGILAYVNAFEILKKKYPKFEFTVIGDGKYRKLIEKKVNVLGFKKDPEKYFQDYHFAFVSRYLSILEAFAAKRLVFALYDNPVKEDYLRQSPFAKFIVIENTPEGIVNNLDEILKNPKKEKEMVAHAFHWVQKQSWEQMIALYLALWKRS